MGFLGPVSTLGGKLVRPHDVTVSLAPREGALEAMVSRVVHLGFEVRIELELPDGEHARAQLTRAQTAELELEPRRHRLCAPADDRRRRCRARRRRAGAGAPQRVTQASGSSASLSIAPGS